MAEFLEFCQSEEFRDASDDDGIYVHISSLQIGYNEFIDPPSTRYLASVSDVRRALWDAYSLLARPISLER